MNDDSVTIGGPHEQEARAHYCPSAEDIAMAQHIARCACPHNRQDALADVRKWAALAEAMLRDLD